MSNDLPIPEIYLSVGIVVVPIDPLLNLELSIVVCPVSRSCVTVARGLIFLPPTLSPPVVPANSSCLLFSCPADILGDDLDCTPCGD